MYVRGMGYPQRDDFEDLRIQIPYMTLVLDSLTYVKHGLLLRHRHLAAQGHKRT